MNGSFSKQVCLETVLYLNNNTLIPFTFELRTVPEPNVNEVRNRSQIDSKDRIRTVDSSIESLKIIFLAAIKHESFSYLYCCFVLYCNTSFILCNRLLYLSPQKISSHHASMFCSISWFHISPLYPLLGWLSDVYFTRYKVIRLAFIITSIAGTGGTIVFIPTVWDINLLHNQISSNILIILAFLGILAIVLGLGLFQANAIQFGMDQLSESLSYQLSSFIHWYYWSNYVGQYVLYLMLAGILVFNSNYSSNGVIKLPYPISDYVVIRFAFSVTLLHLMLAIVGLIVLIRYKKRLTIEKPGHNPLKLIYKVLKYAWKHKFPENRSAFTYWENDIPPRIDLGKDKYGGPFTTEEVEDTKSFFHIFLLLFSLLGFHLSGHGYTTVQKLMTIECPNTWLLMLIGDPMSITTIVIFTCVPLYQLVNARYRQRYIPNIFKRMGLGLFCCLLKVIIEITLQVTQKIYATEHCQNMYPLFYCYQSISHNNSSHVDHCTPGNSIFLILLVVPQILQGLSFLLVFMNALEFICAQAPLRLKGLLIGLWYASVSSLPTGRGS